MAQLHANYVIMSELFESYEFELYHLSKMDNDSPYFWSWCNTWGENA